VTGKLLILDEALKPTLPALLALLDVPVEDAAWQALDPAQRRRRTLDAVKRLLLRESREQPLLLIVEDLHWIDSASQAFLDSLVESLGSARLLLLVNYRPEYQHAWSSKTYYSRIRQDALPAESAGELLDALLGDDPGLAPLKQRLVKRGNPFFLEETVRTLVETKVLEGERGRYRLTRPVQAIQVPATVQAVLAARIDRLSPQDKRLLQVASVVGKDVPSAPLRAVADLSDEALRRGLERLQAAEFLYETGLYPDLEYAFKHALTHEVAYGSLLQDRRRALHGRIADTIEALYRDRFIEHIERVAYHAVQAERWDKASEYLRQAGARAAERSAHRAAVDWLDQALAALGHLPETRETLARVLDVRFDLHMSLFALREHARMRDHMEAAERVAAAIGDRHRLGRALALLCPALRVTGENLRSAEAGRRALAIAAETGDQRLEEEASFWLGQTHANLGDNRVADELFRRCITSLPPDLTAAAARAAPHFESNARAWLASSLAELGRFDEGLEYGAQALRIAQALDDQFRLIIASHHVGLLHLCRGTFADAVTLFEQSVSIGRSRDISDFDIWSKAGLAVACAQLGRIEDAMEWADSSLSAAAHLRREEAFFLAGRREEALGASEQALSLSRQRGERGEEGRALHLLGKIAADCDPSDAEAAERHYREALALATELGMRPLLAHCHLGLGTRYRRTGKSEPAREHLTTAATMYRAMGMGFWLEQVETEMRWPR
jgi:tetratricopeptide (TPR) repeat protein